MVEHIKQFIKLSLEGTPGAEGVASTRPAGQEPKVHINVAVREASKELESLDPLDFEPSVRRDFLLVRGLLFHRTQNLKGAITPAARKELEQVLPVLEGYRGLGSGGVNRVFTFIKDAVLRSIIERDYSELRNKLFPAGAWKSTVIMAGSILEAILVDRLADPAWNAKAKSSPKAQDKKGNQIPDDKWTLENLIDISQDIGRLPKDPASTIHQVLRDYRNFVHPKKEIRAAHDLTEAEAMLAVGALDSVCNVSAL